MPECDSLYAKSAGAVEETKVYTYVVCKPVIFDAFDIRSHYYGASAWSGLTCVQGVVSGRRVLTPYVMVYLALVS